MTLPEGLVSAVRDRVTRDARVPARDVADLIVRFGLDSLDPVLCAALPVAASLADPPISDYRVGAVGLETPSGDLLLGGNLEFPGADLGRTLHAEGVVAIRTFLRASALVTLAIHEARPCAYCRQTLVEYAWAPGLRLIDPHGSQRSLAELYPWPFLPADLGEPGIVPAARPFAGLGLADDPAIPDDVAALLVSIGARAHAPHSGCPSAVVLQLGDGRLVPGATIENVAFNPTVGPLSVALVGLRTGGDGYADVETAWLATPGAGVVDDIGPTKGLLGAIAPGARLVMTTWTGLDRA